ncbi:type II secretion system F family protein [Leifsonia sp. Leaf264]|uniref:type II secretion system F family protein n=1 Tax=Leifsonia sp. Leaf264 TaxID=1736314 RepID=UPI0006F3BF4A|nr:type II secretion system F family protein [Leifsonia sp. Leaf264]KQO97400.1 pilus assembly protein PilC [Leifsonia sp. Leaf264]
MAAPATLAFNYTGRDTEGKSAKGRIEAPNQSAVVSKLKALGVTPIDITEAPAGTGLGREIKIPGFEKKVKLKDLAIAARQMATMTSAGLSLIRTLNILADQTENPALAKVLGEVRSDVETGLSLSDAMRKHPRVFPPIMLNLVKAGETGGFIDEALEKIAKNFEDEAKLRDTIKSALTYPVIVLLMSVVGVIIMLIFVVPIFKTMFEQLGGQLPLPTQVLVVLSENMTWLAPVLIVGSIVFSIWWGQNKHTEKVRAVVDPLKLKLPVFGKILQKLSIARFARNFSTMMASGVPILQSLTIVGETSGNIVIERALQKVQDSVRQGKSIAGPLAEEAIFPTMVVQMIAVGEDSGSLEVMLSKVADFYDQEVQAATEQLTALIEPLMIAFIGVVIGGMVVALYMPVFQIFTLIK